MVRFTDELLDEIKSRNDIVDIVSQYVSLKRKGRNYFGVCPFHNEKSPSLSVSPDRQIFHCFGCGVGGNVIHFISKIENISFPESVQMLAERVGIQLPKSNDYIDEKKLELKNKVYNVNKLAAEFYHLNLYKPSSKEAQNYIKKRKMDNNTLKSFLIGYAGNNNELLAYLKSKGVQEEEMLSSSLIGKSENGRLYDKFRNRLMIPIQDERGRFIAFGGRVLITEEERKSIEQKTLKPMPKYINSPENIVYSKGRNLFGLNVAKKSVVGQFKKLLIVEGYMDAISLFQRGITNVVASLGTALTDNQARLIRKNSEQVILGYDADGAGQNAILRAIEILKGMSIDTRVLQISDAKDPDEYVIKFGVEKLKKCIDNAISVVEFKIKILKQNLDLDNTSDKIKFLNEIAKELSKVDNTMEREVYIDRISKNYNISKEAIYAEVNKLLHKDITSTKVLEKDTVISPIKKHEEVVTDEKVLEREKMIIAMLLNFTSECYNKIKEIVKVEDIQNLNNQIIIKTIYENLDKNYSIENVLSWFSDDEIINYLSGIMAYDYEIKDVNKALEDIEKAYRVKNDKLRKIEILEMLSSSNIDEKQKKDLEEELNRIIKRK